MVLGNADAAQDGRDPAGVCRSRWTEEPGLLAQVPECGLHLGQWVVGAGDCDDLVVEERRATDRLVEVAGSRTDRNVDGAGHQQAAELSRAVLAQLDVEVVGAAGEQLDQTWSSVLGKQAGHADAQQPAPAGCLAHLEDGAVLQPKHLGGPGGQAEAAGGEREPCTCGYEQLVAELFAQLGDVQRHCCLGDLEAGGRLLDRAESDNGGESAQLSRRHGALLQVVAAPVPGGHSTYLASGLSTGQKLGVVPASGCSVASYGWSEAATAERSGRTGGVVMDAVAMVEQEVRDLVRERGLNPQAEVAAMRGLVESVVGDFGERSARDGSAPLADPDGAVRDVLATRQRAHS